VLLLPAAMAVRAILKYPHPALKQRALPVERVDAGIQALVDDLAETMYDAPGVGLAANQVGVLSRVFVVDCAAEDEASQLLVFINPEIVTTAGTVQWEEGCLSFPGITEEIRRAERLTARALDRGSSFRAHGRRPPRRRHPARARSPEWRGDARQAERAAAKAPRSEARAGSRRVGRRLTRARAQRDAGRENTPLSS